MRPVPTGVRCPDCREGEIMEKRSRGGKIFFSRNTGLQNQSVVYVADAVNDRIQVFSEDGVFQNSIGGDGGTCKLYLPYDLSFQGDDMLVVDNLETPRLGVVTAGRPAGAIENLKDLRGHGRLRML